MKLKDFFLGTPEERESVRVLDDLSIAERQHPLSYEQVSRRDANRANWIRLRVRQLLTAAVPTALIASGVYFLKEEVIPPITVIAPTPGPTPPTSKPIESPYLGEEVIRDLYDKGFEFLMHGVPENPTDEDLQVLRNFQLFRQNEVMWVQLTPAGQYLALGEGTLKPAFMAVVPKEFPGLQNKSVLGINYKNTGRPVLQVKPVPITPEWAGIFQLHELVHLIDRVKGFEPPNPTQEQYLNGEARAFSVEILGAVHMTKGEFSKAIDYVIEQYGLKSLQDFLSLLNSDRKHKFMLDLRRFPGSTVTPTPPQSENEDALRVAFCMTAVGQQLIQNQNKPQSEKDVDHRALIQVLMTQSEQGKNIPDQ